MADTSHAAEPAVEPVPLTEEELKARDDAVVDRILNGTVDEEQTEGSSDPFEVVAMVHREVMEQKAQVVERQRNGEFDRMGQGEILDECLDKLDVLKAVARLQPDLVVVVSGPVQLMLQFILVSPRRVAPVALAPPSDKIDDVLDGLVWSGSANALAAAVITWGWQHSKPRAFVKRVVEAARHNYGMAIPIASWAASERFVNSELRELCQDLPVVYRAIELCNWAADPNSIDAKAMALHMLGSMSPINSVEQSGWGQWSLKPSAAEREEEEEGLAPTVAIKSKAVKKTKSAKKGKKKV